MLPFVPTEQEIMVGLLVLLRVSMLIILLPVLGHSLVPPPVKVGLAVLFSLLMYPLVYDAVPPITPSPVGLAMLAGKEIILAGMLSLLAQLSFGAVQFAGQAMSTQMSLALSNVFDPSSSSQIAVVGQLAVTLSMLVWLIAGGDMIFLSALADSFRLFPIGSEWSFHGIEMLNQAASAMFLIALKLMAPILLLMLFIYVAMGLLSRAVPQIQVFFVSFPLTVGLGLLAFALSMPVFLNLVFDEFRGLGSSAPLFLKALSGQ